MIALFPLHTQRIDRRQGPIARQLPRALAALVPHAGWDLVPWLVRRGDEVAHVLLERPLPHDVLAEEASRRGAAAWWTGQVLLRASGCTLEVTSDEGVSLSAPADAGLSEALRAVAGPLAAQLGVDVADDAVPSSDEALQAWCYDADNLELLTAAGPSLPVAPLAEPADAWRHLARVAEHEPSWHAWVVTELSRRLAIWRAADAEHADACAAAIDALERAASPSSPIAEPPTSEGTPP